MQGIYVSWKKKSLAINSVHIWLCWNHHPTIHLLSAYSNISLSTHPSPIHSTTHPPIHPSIHPSFQSRSIYWNLLYTRHYYILGAGDLAVNKTDKIHDLLELRVGPSEYCWSQRGPEFTLDVTLQPLCHMSWGKEKALCVCICVCICVVCV